MAGMKKIAKYGVAGAVVLGVGTLVVLGACGFDPPPKHGGTGTAVAGKCSADAGTFPDPTCDNSDNTCIFSGCKVAASCGSTDTCMPLADNTGKDPANFRLRRLLITVPKALTGPVIQNAVVTANINLKAPQCGEKGEGAFNWLLTVDKANSKIKTGGAPVSSDPFKVGYCYYDHVTPTGIQVTPVETHVTFDSTGTKFDSDPIAKLQVPIFVNGNADDVIVLPVSHVVLKGVTMNDNNNCIGKFQLDALDQNCDDDPTSCARWKTAGALGGYITIEEADGVEVKEINGTLCTLLTSARDANGKCPRNSDGSFNLTPQQQGDYCSKTQKPGDCHDSFWLAATFAASAVKIDDSGSVPECVSGGSPVDAGGDTGPAPSDAGDGGG